MEQGSRHNHQPRWYPLDRSLACYHSGAALCSSVGELKVARIHDIRFILCLGYGVCVGARKGATSDKLQLTVDASTRERMHACLSLILIRI